MSEGEIAAQSGILAVHFWVSAFLFLPLFWGLFWLGTKSANEKKLWAIKKARPAFFGLFSASIFLGFCAWAMMGFAPIFYAFFMLFGAILAFILCILELKFEKKLFGKMRANLAQISNNLNKLKESKSADITSFLRFAFCVRIVIIVLFFINFLRGFLV